ncbi:MAG: NAD(P) transhydrogenase subunit alpha [Alphaproteobacteria bacterium]|jgi:NAD(P) transhydrogenase subunit alpha
MIISLFTIALIVFVLACFVGYHVVWGVTPALHTPLMAVTNAISGIVVVGAMMVAGGAVDVAQSGVLVDMIGLNTASAIQPDYLAKSIGAFGVFLASINIFGGFVVTNRMLSMFKKKEK